MRQRGRHAAPPAREPDLAPRVRGEVVRGCGGLRRHALDTGRRSGQHGRPAHGRVVPGTDGGCQRRRGLTARPGSARGDRPGAGRRRCSRRAGPTPGRSRGQRLRGPGTAQRAGRRVATARGRLLPRRAGRHVTMGPAMAGGAVPRRPDPSGQPPAHEWSRHGRGGRPARGAGAGRSPTGGDVGALRAQPGRPHRDGRRRLPGDSLPGQPRGHRGVTRRRPPRARGCPGPEPGASVGCRAPLGRPPQRRASSPCHRPSRERRHPSVDRPRRPGIRGGGRLGRLVAGPTLADFRRSLAQVGVAPEQPGHPPRRPGTNPPGTRVVLEIQRTPAPPTAGGGP